MLTNNHFKKLTLGVFMAAACGAGQSAYAHTGIKDSTVEPNKNYYTAFTIGHGCQDNPKAQSLLPVTAQSAVFPYSTANAVKIDPNSGAESAIDLGDYIEGADTGVVALSPSMIQDKNVFKKQLELTDGSNVRAIQFTVGKLDTTAIGLIPFKIKTPKFLADSCAKSLQIRIAIANYCHKTKNTDMDNRVDLWMGDMTATTKFNDAGVYDGEPEWPTMTVVNPTPADPASCPGGKNFDIAVQPSAQDINNYLPIKGYWPQ
jgi:hypothetical protein